MRCLRLWTFYNIHLRIQIWFPLIFCWARLWRSLWWHSTIQVQAVAHSCQQRSTVGDYFNWRKTTCLNASVKIGPSNSLCPTWWLLAKTLTAASFLDILANMVLLSNRTLINQAGLADAWTTPLKQRGDFFYVFLLFAFHIGLVLWKQCVTTASIEIGVSTKLVLL